MKFVFGTLAALFGVLAVVGGIGVGVGGFAYGIWLIISAFQASAVSFWLVLKVVFLLGFSGLAGWLTFLFFIFLSSCCGGKICSYAEYHGKRFW